MTGKVGWTRGAGRFGSLFVRAAALCVLVSVAAPPVGSDDAARIGEGEPRPMSGSRIRLREGASPEATDGGGGADAMAAGWSDQGLEEQAGMTAAGGTTVHLHGRYRSSVVLRRDGNGAAAGECITNLPARGRPD